MRITSAREPAAFIFAPYASPSSRSTSISAVTIMAAANPAKLGCLIGDIFQFVSSQSAGGRGFPKKWLWNQPILAADKGTVSAISRYES